ncbi:MAG TPA: helix-turn-helix domain-containing protein [Aliidongia sp.]|uniref:XRE family transcriptional regulator n=1 Tax=Aliidongia sp. TaxID=1914230 RepID=UPI002DDD8DEA|nr:helix-turn-helix domain-containing protein [Aliidongia sp.]HEV2678168.1 helix-turn-helix domain-containing protein [Aliidongia sp.]
MTSNRLREFREQASLSMQALATRVGTTAPQINKLEKGERRLTLDWMTRLATALGIEAKDLLPPTAESHLAVGGVMPPPSMGSEAAPGPILPARDPRDLIPVRSAARGGEEQEMFLEDGPIDYIARPHSLLHVRDAYSIYMIGESMIPRFRPGQLLHVNPYKPPQVGAGVVVTKTNNVVLIKEFVRRTETTLLLKQYNPAAELKYPLGEVRDLHTVVGLDEP